jgi:hypothetical protein
VKAGIADKELPERRVDDDDGGGIVIVLGGVPSWAAGAGVGVCARAAPDRAAAPAIPAVPASTERRDNEG